MALNKNLFTYLIIKIDSILKAIIYTVFEGIYRVSVRVNLSNNWDRHNKPSDNRLDDISFDISRYIENFTDISGG